MAHRRLPEPLAHASETLRDPSAARTALLAILTFVLGLVSVACLVREEWHIPGAWAGSAGLVLGAIAQYLSRSTAQRWVIVIGWGLAFVGTLLNIANGGLW